MTFHEYLINMPVDEMFDLCDEKFNILISNVCPSSITLAQYLQFSEWEWLGSEVLMRPLANGQQDSRWSVIIRRNS